MCIKYNKHINHRCIQKIMRNITGKILSVFAKYITNFPK